MLDFVEKGRTGVQDEKPRPEVRMETNNKLNANMTPAFPAPSLLPLKARLDYQPLLGK